MDVLRTKIEDIVQGFKTLNNKHEKGFVMLGLCLSEVQLTRSWMGWGYFSFEEYLKLFVIPKTGIGRTQIYATIGVIRKLPNVAAEALGEMGISKAQELKKLVVRKGQGWFIPDHIMALATSKTATLDELKATVYSDYPTGHKGCKRADHRHPYRDLGGVFASAEEYAAIKKTFELVAKRIGVESEDKNTKMKEILMFLTTLVEEEEPA